MTEDHPSENPPRPTSPGESPDRTPGPVPFTLRSGERGRVMSFSPKSVVLESPQPSPPGSTMRGQLDGVTCPLEVKVRTCKRLTEDGRFQIEGRLQNARRELLTRLATLG